MIPFSNKVSVTEMSDELNRQILEELNRMNEKLDKLGERKGLSKPIKLLTVFICFAIIGPLLLVLLLLSEVYSVVNSKYSQTPKNNLLNRGCAEFLFVQNVSQNILM